MMNLKKAFLRCSPGKTPITPLQFNQKMELVKKIMAEQAEVIVRLNHLVEILHSEIKMLKSENSRTVDESRLTASMGRMSMTTYGGSRSTFVLVELAEPDGSRVYRNWNCE
jgi:hypothetical protein